jgi:hypothetical protein
VLVCLGAIAFAFLVRGGAYPGRFSVHLVPVAVALFFHIVIMAFGALKQHLASVKRHEALSDKPAQDLLPSPTATSSPRPVF